jgi:hypothetical protein
MLLNAMNNEGIKLKSFFRLMELLSVGNMVGEWLRSSIVIGKLTYALEL